MISKVREFYFPCSPASSPWSLTTTACVSLVCFPLNAGRPESGQGAVLPSSSLALRISERGRGNGLSPLLTAPVPTLLTALWKPAPGRIVHSLSSASQRPREGLDQLHSSSITRRFSSLWPKNLAISGGAASCPQAGQDYTNANCYPVPLVLLLSRVASDDFS